MDPLVCQIYIGTMLKTSCLLLSLYNGYKQDNLLMGDFPEHIFYSTIQEHLYR